MNNYLIGPFLPSIWRDIIFPWLNIEDLAMLRRVCRFFRDDKKLEKMLDLKKKEVFLEIEGYPKKWHFNLEGGVRFKCSEIRLTRKFLEYGTQCNHLIFNSYQIQPEMILLFRNIYFFTSKDMLLKHLQKTIGHLTYDILYIDYVCHNNDRYWCSVEYIVGNLLSKILISNVTTRELKNLKIKV